MSPGFNISSRCSRRLPLTSLMLCEPAHLGLRQDITRLCTPSDASSRGRVAPILSSAIPPIPSSRRSRNGNMGSES